MAFALFTKANLRVVFRQVLDKEPQFSADNFFKFCLPLPFLDMMPLNVLQNFILHPSLLSNIVLISFVFPDDSVNRSVEVDGVTYELFSLQPLGTHVTNNYEAAEFCFNQGNGLSLPENPNVTHIASLMKSLKLLCETGIPLPYTTL